MADLPWMKLGVDRFLGSSRVKGLPKGMGQGWWYLGLLVHQWARGQEGLPANIGELAEILDVREKLFRPVWEGAGGRIGMREFFEERGGRLFNKRCEDIYSEELAYRNRKSLSGKAGGIASAEARRNDRSTTVQQPFDDCCDLPQANSKPPSTPTSSHKNPLSPKGGNTARMRRGKGTSYRAHEAARDERASHALSEKARAVIEASKAAEAEAHPPPDAVRERAERARKRREVLEERA